MNANKVLLNSLLALAITGMGSAYAADQTQTQTKIQDRDAVRAEHREATSGMTAEQRDQYRAEKQSEMTTEQRAAMRAEKQNKKAEQKKLKAEKKKHKADKKIARKNAEKGNGMKLHDGSGAGAQHSAQGSMGR